MNNRIFILVLVPISMLLNLLARYSIGFAEFYATKIYPFLASVIFFFTSKVRFSIAEVVIIVMIIILIAYLIITLTNTIINKSAKFFKSFLINISVFLSIVYFLFVLFCGINYHRNEFTYYSGLEVRESSKKELIELCEILIKDANEIRAKLNSNANGVAALLDNDYNETAKRAKSSFDNISNKYNILKGNYPSPKLVYFSSVMSQAGITGVFFPFTFEANVNVHIPQYQVPATMLHELVHLRGFMREDEANFISYLACINSGFDDFAYSGTMLALTYSMNALYSEDYDAYVSMYSKYSEDVKNDLKYASNYWSQFETKVSEISSKVNDSYLKANNQYDGVKSYGRMVDLLLAYYTV